jgi:hypothetical protein
MPPLYQYGDRTTPAPMQKSVMPDKLLPTLIKIPVQGRTRIEVRCKRIHEQSVGRLEVLHLHEHLQLQQMSEKEIKSEKSSYYDRPETKIWEVS